jgi:hypothetical protein
MQAAGRIVEAFVELALPGVLTVRRAVRAGSLPGAVLLGDFARPTVTLLSCAHERTGILPAMEPVLKAPVSVEQPKPAVDAEGLMRTCANCGAAMEERKCKLICHGCGYFLSCADYY